MQAVPSLVGTGTAIAAAAAGLVFSQPPESEAPWSSPSQPIFPADYDGFRVPPRRPRTSAAPDHTCPSPTEDFPYASFRQFDDTPGPRSSQPAGSTISPQPVSGAQVLSPKSSSRRHTLIPSGDVASRPIAEHVRDSVSSRESWIRRLSLRPLSQHGSSRSSMGPDSSSMTFSHGSGVPMLGQPPVFHATPNKLVKRTTSGQNGAAGGHSRRGSKSQVLTLRRPATSHQRSATLQQFQNQGAFAEPLSPNAGFSFERDNLRRGLPPASPTVVDSNQPSGKWTSFFHARRSISSGRDFSGMPAGSNSTQPIFPRKRLSLAPGHVCRAYLTKPNEIAEVPVLADEVAKTLEETGNPTNSTDTSPGRRTRRSMSVHFSSASHWIPRSGSIRRPRRSTIDAKGGPGRDSVTLPGIPDHPQVKPDFENPSMLPDVRQEARRQPEPDLKQLDHPRTRKRNSSSPLPPLNRLSSFNLDITQSGLSTSSSAAPPRPFDTPINYTRNSQPPPGIPHSRGPSGERSVTLVGSDVEARDGVSGDDEDTDFKSDDMYDSFRTMASSNRPRSVETPLESMFDESPHSTASNSKTKRLSIQEILGHPWRGEANNPKADESHPTRIRAAHLAEGPGFGSHDRKRDDLGFDAPQELLLADRDFGRLSFDDDDDDWARDDENPLSNHLSPPSSTNSRRICPKLRRELRNISGNGNREPQRDSLGDRPRSNIFDWAEPSVHDKHDTDMHRPKTVHGKQELDLRGGRSVTRKPPGAAHVRSQSVPVVPDPSDGSKPPPKFGTWGLGTKTASEDWDDDFEFDVDESAACSAGGKDSATSFSMVVPASIQATQPSVKAHSDQIRELSLLVNDLKRLCRHGKDLDILKGPAAAKWAEAQNIIALASPDEELSSTEPSMDLDQSKIDVRYLEEGFDGSLLDFADEPFGTPEREMSKTAVVRERHSVRRRSVFSPDDDIFGGNGQAPEGSPKHSRPRTPDGSSSPKQKSAVITTVIEAMQQQRSTSDPAKSRPTKAPDTKLFFDTNSLQELVKRAGQLRDSLSDVVRRAELLTQSPAGTPRRERHARHNLDGSPAFTRVFAEPSSSPSRRLPHSHSTNSVLSRASVEAPRMQLMTVS
ncbi:hypothetical protein VTK56DRAFT_2850 [Thermocarpiscus australiensis]